MSLVGVGSADASEARRFLEGLFVGKPDDLYLMLWTLPEKVSLSEPQRRLLEVMQQLNFGRIGIARWGCNVGVQLTKSSLNPGQRRTAEIIQAMGFGVIERLLIQGGFPCFEPEPRIVQAIKLASEPGQHPDPTCADFTLKKAFENLFDHLTQLGDGVVDIEVQHSAPFRLVLERRYKELL
jgi:hypothetical protein